MRETVKGKLLRGVRTFDSATGTGGESLGEEIQKIEQEAIAGAKAFVANAGTDLVTDAQAGWVWLMGEIQKIEPVVLGQLKGAIQEIAEDFEKGESEGVVMADVLTVLARDGLDDALAIKTDVIQGIVGLVTANPGASTLASAHPAVVAAKAG